MKFYPNNYIYWYNIYVADIRYNLTGIILFNQLQLRVCAGNAMGFVRLVRSGSLRCSSNTVRFLPSLDDLTSFETLCSRKGDEAVTEQETSDNSVNVSGGTLSAARNLDVIVHNLQQTFQKDTDFFKVCVKFSQQFFYSLDDEFLFLILESLNFVTHFFFVIYPDSGRSVQQSIERRFV